MAFELPEAMTVARQMDSELRGVTIRGVHLAERCASLIKQGFINLHEVDIAGRRVESVESKGKWIFVKLDQEMLLLFALETGGKLLLHRQVESLPPKFHVRLDFGDGSFLTEQIVGWGWAKAVKKDELELHRYPGKLGLSPVDSDAFTFESLCAVLDRYPGKAVKYVMLEQGSIAGIGNGYLQDILFRAGIHPKRKAGQLSREERLNLYDAVVGTLSEAVRLGGSGFEHDLYGSPGRYERVMGGHMKGKPCPRCGRTIEKLRVLGSNCYVCPKCQV